MRKRMSLLIAALMLALTMSVGSVAFAANPHAGQSGHFKKTSNPCQNNPDHPKCPPFGR
jgi:hypothetical protein